MPYTTVEDLSDRYGEGLPISLTDRAETPTGAIVQDTADQAIADADALIDGYPEDPRERHRGRHFCAGAIPANAFDNRGRKRNCSANRGRKCRWHVWSPYAECQRQRRGLGHGDCLQGGR
ncbi:phage protein Gp36 family protein [Tritonibacter horizontis]|uniref:phage protein Gp36 family protein n=1 Tax=Tritonibacter horizontis TaxID=1768241 RepID=UPI0009E6D7BE